MPKDPLVSVAIVSYNQVLYIAQAIDSVLMQKTDVLFEIVVGEIVPKIKPAL